MRGPHPRYIFFSYYVETACASHRPRASMGCVPSAAHAGEIARDAAKRAEDFALHLTPVSASRVTKVGSFFFRIF